MFLPVPFLVPFLGGSTSKDSAREIDTMEIVGSIYFIIIFVLAVGNTLLAWFNISPACPSIISYSKKQGCDIYLTGMVTAISVAGALIIATLLFLSVRRLYRAIRR